jgi:hypothetical protein
MLAPVLYTIYTADLPTNIGTEIATFADDTAILASDQNAITASQKLQTHLSETERWLVKWRMKANATKSTHVTFTARKRRCPPATLNNTQIPQEKSVKYLSVHLNRQLLWKVQIQKKKKQLGNKYKNMWWLIGKKSQLSVTNELLLYKVT